MRTIHIRDPGAVLEDLLDLVAEIESHAAPQPEGASMVYVVVHDRALGPVPLGVWELVQAELDARVSTATRVDSAIGTEPARAPLRRLPDDEMPLPLRPATGTRRRRRPLRVLIAEHDPDLRSRLMIAFSARGFDAVAVGDGLQASHELSAHPPDALIAELDLPRVAGAELLVRTKSGDRPVAVTILVSAALPQRMLPQCIAADAALGRPFGPATVVEVVCARLSALDTEDAAGAG